MTSYWLDEAPEPRRATAVDDPEIVVVGAGVTGCAAALRLARAGKRVRLHDARGVAEGASGRNGGFALRGMPAPIDVTAASVGEETAREMIVWTERAIDTIEALAGDAFRRVGSLRIAVDDEERDELFAEYEALVAAGFAAEWVEESRLPLAGRFTAALRHPPDGVLQPARWVRRLAASVAAEGVEIRRARACPVDRGARRRHRHRLHGRLSERTARSDRGADHPDPRAGYRHRADPGPPLRGATLRAPRIRLLASGGGRPHRRGRLPGRLLRDRVHGRRRS